MKKFAMLASLLVLVGLVFAFGPSSASAQTATDTVVATVYDGTLPTDLDNGEGRGGRIALPRHGRTLAMLIRDINKACPCNGPDGNGWGADDPHGKYVACVQGKVDFYIGLGLPEALATKIMERAGKSPIGTDGFTCPGKREPGDVLACMLGAMSVAKACPCAGITGTDGTVAPWADHEAFVTCVQAKVTDLQANGLPEACATKMIEGATNSKVGTAGFVCPKDREKPGEDPARPGRPRR
jgi:hypothetical protein